jgi:hypothetical protein
MFGTTRGTKKKHPEVDAFLVYKLQDCGFLSQGSCLTKHYTTK